MVLFTQYDGEGKLIPARRRSKAEIEAAAGGTGKFLSLPYSPCMTPAHITNSSPAPSMTSTPLPKAKASTSTATNGATSAKGKGPATPTLVLDDNGELPSVSSVPAFGAGGVKMASPIKKNKPVVSGFRSSFTPLTWR